MTGFGLEGLLLVEPGEGALDGSEVVGVDLVVDVSRVVLVSHARAHPLPPL